MPPRDLPGLYWDAERNRYFPIASRPPAPTTAVPTAPQRTTDVQYSRRRRRRQDTPMDTMNKEPESPMANLDEDRKAEVSVKRRRGLNNHLLSTQALQSSSWDWAAKERLRKCATQDATSRTTKSSCWDVPTSGHVTAFCTYSATENDVPNGSRWHLMGDSLGWIFRCNTTQGVLAPESIDNPGSPRPQWLPWSAELNLQPGGQISSLAMDGSRWVATGSGKAPRVVFSDFRFLDQMCIITLSRVFDLWASHLFGKELALGSNKKALYLSDMEHSHSPQFMHVDSDVLSVVQDANLIYTGSRNGSIHRYDKRIGFKNRGHLVLDGRFHEPRASHNPSNQDRKDERSPVLKLELMGKSPARTAESGLFVSHMNGDLQLFDLRRLSSMDSAKNEPVVQYYGHVNSYRKDLGIAIDHENDFLYAAGQDCQIRGWRLSTGEAITPPPTEDSSAHFKFSELSKVNPFLAVFDDPIEVLQVPAPARHVEALPKAEDDERRLETRAEGPINFDHSTSLWAATGRNLWKWELGQRVLP